MRHSAYRRPVLRCAHVHPVPHPILARGIRHRPGHQRRHGFPLVAETDLLVDLVHAGWSPLPERLPDLVAWLDRVHEGLVVTGRDYPFIAYGTDWLAFAHLVIAVAFWGPIRDPLRNVWVVQFGMISCLGVVPLALIAGSIRGIPWWWQLIDISFGVFGVIPLLLAYRGIRRLPGAVG